MPGRGYYLVQRTGIAAKLNSAVGGVGAGNVQLVGGDALAFIQDLNGSLVIFAGVAKHIGDDDDICFLAQLGQLFVNEGSRAHLLQSDGMEHARCCPVKPRRRIPRHGLFRQTLDYESAELVEVDYILELDPVAKSAAGGNHGVFELNAGEANGQVGSTPGGGGGSGHRDCSVTRRVDDSKAVLEFRPKTCNAGILRTALRSRMVVET